MGARVSCGDDGDDDRSCTAWERRWLHLETLDDDTWDRAASLLVAAWWLEYREAFMSCAMARPGWTREDAEAWVDAVIDDALDNHCGTACPCAAARRDVEACEFEFTNAA